MRCGDHLPAHKHIKNIATCETTPTEHLLNAGRRPQTSQKARKSPCTWVGQKKKRKKQRGRERGTERETERNREGERETERESERNREGERERGRD